MSLLFGIAIGAIGALIIEHGWGWVLAKVRDWRTGH